MKTQEERTTGQSRANAHADGSPETSGERIAFSPPALRIIASSPNGRGNGAGPVQMQEAREGEAPDREEAEQLNPELEALLDEIRGEEVTPPAFEAIAATTPTQNSAGELTERITRMWRRQRISVDDAARAVASGDPQRGAPHATQSAETPGSERFSPRWVIYFGAWNYPGSGSDLQDVRAHLRQGSPLQEALQGSYDRVISVRNPTGSEMGDRVRSVILDEMFPLVESGNIGSLTVYFEGHGGADGIAGVDWGDLSFQDMVALANVAREFDIHLTYILDTCNIGEIVNLAQAARGRELASQLDELTGEDAESLRRNTDSIRTVFRANRNLGLFINDLYAYRGSLQRRDSRDWINQRIEEITSNAQTLREHVGSEAAWLTGEAIDHIETLLVPFERALSNIRDRHPRIDRRILGRIQRNAAPLIDFLTDCVNQSMDFMEARIRENRSRQP